MHLPRARTTLTAFSTLTTLAALVPLALLTFANASHAASFVIADASPEYTYTVNAECKEDRCEGEATVVIRRKNGTVVQELTTPDLSFYLNEAQQKTANNTWRYRDQSAIEVGDFNFDGSTDLAIRNGNNGPYSGPTYDVYVFNRTRQQFVPSASLTALVSDNLGMFQVDKARKRLITFTKSGCCWHQTTHYAVIPGKDLQEVYSKEEGLTTNGKRVEVTTATLVGKKWVKTFKSYPAATYYK